MNTIMNLLAGNVHVMHTEETSKPRMLVLNHTTKQAWVNVTLACNTCPACQKRVALAGERELLEVVNGVVDGHLWAEIPYPESGDAKDVTKAIFTPTRIESEVRGILKNARMIEGVITWETDR
jgi:hypothetical protein